MSTPAAAKSSTQNTTRKRKASLSNTTSKNRKVPSRHPTTATVSRLTTAEECPSTTTEQTPATTTKKSRATTTVQKTTTTTGQKRTTTTLHKPTESTRSHGNMPAAAEQTAQPSKSKRVGVRVPLSSSESESQAELAPSKFDRLAAEQMAVEENEEWQDLAPQVPRATNRVRIVS